MTEKANWHDLMQNPKTLAIKKLLVNVLGDKYVLYNDLADRISHYLVTETDVQTFAKMIGDIYEKSYTQCVNDYKTQLAKLGIKVSFTQKNLADSR